MSTRVILYVYFPPLEVGKCFFSLLPCVLALFGVAYLGSRRLYVSLFSKIAREISPRVLSCVSEIPLAFFPLCSTCRMVGHQATRFAILVLSPRRQDLLAAAPGPIKVGFFIFPVWRTQGSFH